MNKPKVRNTHRVPLKAIASGCEAKIVARAGPPTMSTYTSGKHGESVQGRNLLEGGSWYFPTVDAMADAAEMSFLQQEYLHLGAPQVSFFGAFSG